MFGPNFVYKCPKCGKFTTNRSLLSGNTTGATLYSDGRMIAPMLMEFPFITKCERCKEFYWLVDKNLLGVYGYEYKYYSKIYTASCAVFLSLHEYIEAINMKIYTNKDEENYLRLRLWWAFNHRTREDENIFISNDKTRENKNIFIDKDDKEIYESNCIKMIETLDKNTISGKLRSAELFRNLGDYVECNNILDLIHEEEYICIRDSLRSECEKNNQYTIELKNWKKYDYGHILWIKRA
jgi:hypothetical protein